MNSEDGVPAYSASNKQTPKARSSDDKISFEDLPRRERLIQIARNIKQLEQGMVYRDLQRYIKKQEESMV